METKLWLLRPIDEDSGPWEPWYDKAFGFIVRATSEDEARKLADGSAGYENYADYEEKVRPWLDAALSSCVLLENSGDVGVILMDFRAG